MSTKFERTKEIISIIGFTTLVVIPLECIKMVCLASSVLLLPIFYCGEYIITGKEKYSEKWVNFLESGFRKEVECLANKIGIVKFTNTN